MARDKQNQIDMTFLSLKLASKRGFPHRDYLAHCLRWSHAIKLAVKTKPYRILDLGCGVELPLAKALYTGRYPLIKYLGVDYGPIKPDINFGKWALTLMPETDASTITSGQVVAALDQAPDMITNFEVLEHMLPVRAAKLLLRIQTLMDQNTVALISTPCYDAHVGAAANHINEFTYLALEATLKACGFEISNRYGTFASQRDWERAAEAKFGSSGVALLGQLKGFFDTEVLACVTAPLFPEVSRNVLWELRRGVVDTQPLVDLIMSKGIYELGQCQDAQAWLDFMTLLLGGDAHLISTLTRPVAIPAAAV